jgi:ATP-binding cassette, subfamily B, bacterial MsbA
MNKKFIKNFLIKKSGSLLLLLILLMCLGCLQSLFIISIGPLLEILFSGGSFNKKINIFSYLPKLLKELVAKDTIYYLDVEQMIFIVPGVILLLVLFKNLFSFLYNVQLGYIGSHLSKDLRDILFTSLLNKNFTSINKTSAARWMSCIMNDVSCLQVSIFSSVSNITKAAVVILSSLLAMIIIAIKATFVLVFLVIVFVVFFKKTGRKFVTLTCSLQGCIANLAQSVLSMRKRHEFVMATNSGAREFKLFERDNKELYLLSRHVLILKNIIAPFMEFLGYLFFAISISCYTRGYFFADLSQANILVLFTSIGLLIKPLKVIGEDVSSLNQAIGVLRHSQIISKNDELAEEDKLSSTNDSCTKFISAYCLNDVSIDLYEKGKIKIKNFCFRETSCIAITGSSGSGKSTILRCLSGLIEPNIWNANISWNKFIDNVTYCSQNPFLFKDSVRNNLLYGSNVYNHSEQNKIIAKALSLSQIEDVIASLPQNIDEQMDSLSCVLSGGQSQRVHLARSLIRKKKNIILLDEPSSSLDLQCERKLMTELIRKTKKEKKILIVVSHRVELLELFDEVYKVENFTLQKIVKKQESVCDDLCS